MAAAAVPRPVHGKSTGRYGRIGYETLDKAVDAGGPGLSYDALVQLYADVNATMKKIEHAMERVFLVFFPLFALAMAVMLYFCRADISRTGRGHGFDVDSP